MYHRTLTSKPARRPLPVFIVITMLLAGAWSACLVGENDAAVIGNCSSEVHCFASQNCQIGGCADGPADVTQEVSLLITPGASREDLAPNWVRNVPMTTGRLHPTFQLAPPLQVEGTVTRRINADTDDGVPEPATVFFRALTGVPGNHFTTAAGTDITGRFVASLPGTSYEATIALTRDDMPDVVTRIEDIGVYELRALQLRVPATNYFVAWQGTVQRIDSGGLLQPVSSALVFAVSERSGVQSTSATTGADGSFVVYVDPAEAPYSFHVRPRQQADELDGPAFDLPDVTFEAATPEIIVRPNGDDGPDTAELPGAGLVAVRWNDFITVRGTVVDADGLPVSAAQILATSDLVTAADTASAIAVRSSRFTQRAESTSNGEFTMRLPPDEDFIVTAFVDNDERMLFAEATSLSTTPEGIAEAAMELVAVGPSTLSGTALAPASRGTDAGQVIVRYELIEHSDHPVDLWQIAPVQTVFSAISDANGHYELPLLPGRYRRSAEPVDGQPFPFLYDEVQVAADDTELPPVQFEAGGYTSGVITVADDSGEPVANAAVEAWIEQEGEQRKISSATTDSNGRYVLVLPTGDAD